MMVKLLQRYPTPVAKCQDKDVNEKWPSKIEANNYGKRKEFEEGPYDNEAVSSESKNMPSFAP